GFSDYLSKRKELFFQKIHLVEVDLLIAGERLPMRPELPRADHYAIVSRSEFRPKAEVFAWNLGDAIPNFPIPLRPPDRDVVSELAQVFAMAYDKGRYGRALDYSRPLKLPLSPNDLRWAMKIAKTRKR